MFGIFVGSLEVFAKKAPLHYILTHIGVEFDIVVFELHSTDIAVERLDRAAVERLDRLVVEPQGRIAVERLDRLVVEPQGRIAVERLDRLVVENIEDNLLPDPNNILVEQ
jgi:hypothetical protein